MKKQTLFLLLSICNSILASKASDPKKEPKIAAELGKPCEESIPKNLSMAILPQESVLNQKNASVAAVEVSVYEDDGILCKTNPKGVKIGIFARTGFSMRRENIHFDNSARVEFEALSAFSDVNTVSDTDKAVLTHASAAALKTLQNAKLMGAKIPTETRWRYTCNGIVVYDNITSISIYPL